MQIVLGNRGAIKIEGMKLFDYIFYRVYRAYKKRDSNPEIYATNVLALMEFFFLLSILAIIRLFFDFPIPNKLYIIPGVLLIIVLTWYKYGFNVDVKKLEADWGEEDKEQRRLRGWLIIISLVGFILFPILIGILKHNLGII